jgi:hypothetical protein
MQNKQYIAIAIGYIYKFITVLYCSKKFYKFKQVSNNLLYNDFIVNIYTIGLGTSFYNLLVPLHTNTVILIA